MNEMVERVAMAIRDVVVMRPDWEDDEENRQSWERTSERQRGFYIAEARAAIEAMREPTDKMAKAGSNTIDEKMPDAKALRQVLYIWADMIDEALK